MMNASSDGELWWNELCATASEPALDWLWHGYLVPGNVTLLTSQWKAGKTTLLAMLLGRMKAGGMVAGLPVRAGKAVVISEESPAHWVRRGQRFGLGDHVCWICRPFGGRPSPDEWRALVDRLRTLHERHGLALVAIDPLATFLPGRDENSAAVMLEALLPLQRLTKQGLAVLILHHPRKQTGLDGHAARGSGALTGFVDVQIEMHWYAGPAADDRRRHLQAWSRYEETPRQLVIELNAEGTDYTALGDVDEAANVLARPQLRAVLEAAEGKLTRREILERWPEGRTKPGAAALWRWLDEAVRAGAVQCDGAGHAVDPYRYWLASRLEEWKRDPLLCLRMQSEDAMRKLQRRIPVGPS